ncbi:MAG: alpha/beta fold hydrolase [Bacteroidota bacterium]
MLPRLAALVLLLTLAAGLLPAEAQPVLKRQAQFGVWPAPVTPDIAAELGLEAPTGVVIQQVMDGLTGDALELEAGDVLLTVNGEAVASPQALVAMVGEIREGDVVTLEVVRGGARQTLVGAALPKPFETDDTAEVLYDAVPFQDGALRAIAKKPLGPDGQPQTGPMPTVYFIQGYTCASIDFGSPQHPYRLLIDGLVDRGYAVFRVEKPGMGDSAGTSDCSAIGYDEEMEAFTAAYDHLLTYDWVDRDNVFLLGHSMGGLQAPMLAAMDRFSPKGVAVYGTGMRPWRDYILDLIRTQDTLLGQGDPVDKAAKARAWRPAINAFFDDQTPPAELAATETGRAAMTDGLGWNGDRDMIGRDYTFWQELGQHDATVAWANTDAYVLSLYGESDIAALHDEDQRLLVRVVNHYRPGTAVFQRIPETNHPMLKVGTPEEYTAMLKRGENPYQVAQFNPAVTAAFAAWLDATVSKPAL